MPGYVQLERVECPSELADELTVELVDEGDGVPGEWARRTVPGDFLREGGRITFTVALPTRRCRIEALVLRDGQTVLARWDMFGITLWWFEAVGGDSVKVTYPGLLPPQ